MRQKNKASTARETERLLRKHFAPILKERALETISSHDIATVVDGLLPTPSEANHAFAAMRGFCRWATRRRYIRHSPCEGLALPARLIARERVLSDDELAAVFKAATGYPFGSIVRLLILTAQRRGEISGLRWNYIDEQEQTITLPASLTKNKRQHAFPYGRMCGEVLAGIPKVDDVCLFPARGNGEHTYCGWSKARQYSTKSAP